MTEPERVRLDPYIRQVGHVEDMDGVMCPVGVDYDAVVIGPHRFTSGQAVVFAQLFVSAVWQAGQQKRQLDEQVHEADGGGTMAGLCPGGCGCRLGTDDADRLECGCDGGCCDG